MASQMNPAEIARLERYIASAERQIETKELRLRQAAIEGRSAENDEFDLQRMQLLLTILHEGRDRAIRQAAEEPVITVRRLSAPEVETAIAAD